jgi:hypothetical protein
MKDTMTVEFSNIEGFGLRTVYPTIGSASLGDSYAVVKFSTKERWITTKIAALQWLLDHDCPQTTLEKLVEEDNKKLEQA